MEPANSHHLRSTDPRVLRTQEAVCSALLDLLDQEADLGAISISSVAAAAGVTRRTFYAHFRSPEDIARHISSALFVQVSSSIPDHSLQLPLSGGKLGIELFTQFQSHAGQLRVLLSKCPMEIFHGPVKDALAALIHRICDLNGVDRFDDFELLALVEIAGGAGLGILSAWAERDFAEPPERIAAVFGTLIFPGLDQFLSSGRPQQ